MSWIMLNGSRIFSRKGIDIRWASLIYDDSPLSIASLAEEQEVLSHANNPKPTPAVPRDNFREVFATWSRSVPLIVALGEYGDATGSGFLVDHRGKLLVVTNRHVVEGAAKGIEVIFFQGVQRMDERTLDVASEDVQLIAVHRSADVALLDISKCKGVFGRPEFCQFCLLPKPMYRKWATMSLLSAILGEVEKKS